MLRIAHALIVLLMALTGSARADSPMAAPVDGEPFPAELAAVDASWQVTFRSQQQPREMPAAGLVEWGACLEPLGGTIVVTADGGLLVADVIRADAESLTVASALFGRLILPLETLSGAIFDPPAGRHSRDLLLDRLAKATGNSDRLLLHNGDELTGFVLGLQDDALELETDAGSTPVPIDAVVALVLNPELKQAAGPPGLRAWVGLADGSRLIATQLAIDGSSLALTTSGGQTWKTSREELVALQPLDGRAVYLSDLPAADYSHTPFLTLHWPYRTDRNVTGGLLRCGGRLYLKGLGMHSAARLTYRLDGRYRRFQAELGVDDSSGGGSVRFRVLLDGQPKYASEVIRGGMAPVPVSVDVSDAEKLELAVDFAERADEQDHANWLGARLIP